MSTINRNKGIDILRVICALMIVFIHNGTSSMTDLYIRGLCRVAVPVFFMITGYLYLDVKNRSSQKKQIGRSILLILETTVFYIVLNYLLLSKSGKFTEWLFNKTSSDSIVDIILWNVNPILHRLWYLSALFYVLVIVFIFDKKNKMSLLIKISIPLFIICLVIGPYSQLFFGQLLRSELSRNWLFTGLPFFAFGYYLKQKEGKPLFKNGVVSIAIAFGLNFLEIFLLGVIGIKQAHDIYLTSPITAYALFMFFKDLNIKTKVGNFLSYLGMHCSLHIYQYHKASEQLINKLFGIKNATIMVFTLTALLSLIYVLLKERIRSIKHVRQ